VAIFRLLAAVLFTVNATRGDGLLEAAAIRVIGNAHLVLN
jgi:hypothetical protein